MVSGENNSPSLSELHGSVDTTKGKTGIKSLFAFLGPAYLISVGYMDPGNWATDIAAGSQFGYSLLWVLLMSNLMALLLQSLSARLGIVKGLDLAQATRDMYPNYLRWPLYILAEIGIAACDLAEVLGMAIGLQLLFHLSLMNGVLISVLDTFVLFYLQRKGMRKMEAFIISLVVVIGVSMFIEVFFASPIPSEVITGLQPIFKNEQAVYIAIGIIGATVMPHNLYLHSALVQTRKIDKSPKGLLRAIKFNFIDSAIALNVAFLVNACMLILAAAVFYKVGLNQIADIRDAHQLLQPLLGSKLAPILFALALIAAGQSSTITGTLAGQVVMEGFLHLRINPLARRLLTRVLAIGPAIAVIYFAGESKTNDLLIFSQVILSIQLPFAVLPLIHAVSSRSIMGDLKLSTKWKLVSWVVAALLVYLNVRMVSGFLLQGLDGHNGFLEVVYLLLAALLLVLLLIVLIYPLLAKRKAEKSPIHKKIVVSPIPKPASLLRISIAMDFNSNAEKLLSYALSQSNTDTKILLIHIVESAGSKWHGSEIMDQEVMDDADQLESFVIALKNQGLQVEGKLGFGNRVDEIVRIVNEDHSQLLIMGAHRHTGLKDLIYGETVDRVRHKLEIPVMVVNL
jgi:manganese transport protein